MGKIDAESSIDHFSHPHPLKLISLQSSTTNNICITCSICTKQASGLVYACESCDYCLHKPCSKIPRTLKNHHADKNHALTLLSKPSYGSGQFRCNACGVVGSGFCYSCAACELDLHVACTFARSTIEAGSGAHDHPLELCHAPPYDEKAFVCDVCGAPGSNHWLYRCAPCGFDAHLKCAKRRRSGVGDPPPQQPQTTMINSRSVNDTCPYTIGSRSSWHELHRYNTAPSFVVQQQQQPMRNDVVQNVVNGAIEGIIEAAANQLGQILLQNTLGN